MYLTWILPTGYTAHYTAAGVMMTANDSICHFKHHLGQKVSLYLKSNKLDFFLQGRRIY